MKKLFTLIALIGFVMLAGCTQPEEPVLTPILTDCTIGAEGGEMTISVATNQTLQVTSDASWLTVPNATKAVTTETVKAIAEANTTTKQRTAKINITAGELKATVKVTQAGLTPEIEVNAASFPIGAEGGDITMGVTSNVDYKVAINVGWITRNGNTFTVASNESESDRTGTVTFSYEKLSKVVTVKQKGRTPDPYMEMAPTLKSVSPKGETFDVTVSTNQGTPEGKSDAEWITVSGTSVTVAENPEPEPRSAIVIFTAGGMSKALTVSQAPKSVLDNAGESTFTVPAAGDDISITVRSNVEYTVSVGDCDWITQTKAGSLKEYEHVFHVAANDGTAARTAAISFTYDASLTFSVSVAQEAFVPVINPAAEEVKAGAEGGPASVAVEANCEYEAACEAEWISITGQGQELAFEVAPNSEPEERQAEILLSYKGVVISSLNVIQAGLRLEPTDLSENGTANCYIVDVDDINAEGYTFDCTVAGNGRPEPFFVEMGFTVAYPAAGTSALDEAHYVRVPLNQNNCIDPASVAVADGKVSFKATGAKGNAKIQVRDANDDGVWVWTIWCTDRPAEISFENFWMVETYTLLDRNLGAITSEPGCTEAECGLYYMFGDPIGYTIDEWKNASVYGNQMKDELAHSPVVPYCDFGGSSTYEWFNQYGCPYANQVFGCLWGAYGNAVGSQWPGHNTLTADSSFKTMYDPCPPGYKVMAYDVLAGYINTDDEDLPDFTADQYGTYIDGFDSTGAPAKLFFPYNGFVYQGGYIYDWATHGPYSETDGYGYYVSFWTSAHNRTNMAYPYLIGAKDANRAGSGQSGAVGAGMIIGRGCGVRCITE